jgi:hypothetical protein
MARGAVFPGVVREGAVIQVRVFLGNASPDVTVFIPYQTTE